MAEAAWMLDTNTLSALIRSPRGRLLHQILAREPEQLCTSVIVASELRFGARRKNSPELSRRVEQMLGGINILPLDGTVDAHYADIRAILEAAGTPIGANDLFIAAHARSRDLALVTHNLREFNRVPGLRVENWMDGQA